MLLLKFFCSIILSIKERKVNIVDKMLASFAHGDAKIEVFDDRVVFTHKTYQMLFASLGGTKTVYIQDITSVEFKEPTLFTAGFLQVNFPGKNMDCNPAQPGGDEYAVTIGFKKQVSDARIVLDCINQLISDCKNKERNQHTSTISAADELLKFKNLCDMGVITQAEFEAKKKQLLGL